MAITRLTPVERRRIVTLGLRGWSLRVIVAALGTGRSLATVRAVLIDEGIPRREVVRHIPGLDDPRPVGEQGVRAVAHEQRELARRRRLARAQGYSAEMVR